MSIIFNLVVIAAAICGFITAFYIRRHRTSGSPLVCPLDSNCEAVVNSHYATTFGLPNELLGLIYYGLMILVYLFFFFFPDLIVPKIITAALLLISFGSFLFSLYLLHVQLVKIKEWCTWCIFSSLCSTVIFLAIFASWFAR